MVRWWASFFVLTRINHRQHFGVFQSAVVAYIDSAGNVVALMVPNYQVDGKTGTWLPYDSEVVEGVCFFMMRNEQRRDAVSPIVVDSKGVFVTEAPNGFENVRATITEYVRRAERKQQDVTEHEKCLTNGTYEGGRIVVRFKYEQSIQDAVRALHTE